MTTFFILSFLYFFLLPIGYILIMRWQRRKRTKAAPYKLYHAMNSLLWLDEKAIMDVLQSDIDIPKVYNRYYELYNIDLQNHLAEELLDGDTFNKAIAYFK